jgi:hypothetical protein
VTSRPDRPIARAALSGGSSTITRGCAPGTRRKPRCAPRKSPIGPRRTAASGAAKASPAKCCRSARIALIAHFGAGPRVGSIPSTAATGRGRGGRKPESAAVTRPGPSLSRDRDRSGAPRKAQTFAPRVDQAPNHKVIGEPRCVCRTGWPSHWTSIWPVMKQQFSGALCVVRKNGPKLNKGCNPVVFVLRFSTINGVAGLELRSR